MTEFDTDWSLWRSFLAVAEQGGLSQAARALHLTQPTIGRHIDQLEASCGGALFTRSQTGMAPTALARALIPEAKAMEASARTLARVARSAPDDARGVVRITASEIVGVEILPPLLAAYRADWPGVEVELVLSDEQEDLLNRTADIAVRMTRPTQQRLVARKIATATGGLYAAKAYVDRRGAPTTLDDLSHHDMVGPDDARFSADLGSRQLTSRDFTFRTGSDVAGLAALRAGLGIGAVQHAIARADDRLTRVLPELEVFSLDVWLTMHEGLKADRIVRSAFDFLSKRLYRPDQSPSER